MLLRFWNRGGICVILCLAFLIGSSSFLGPHSLRRIYALKNQRDEMKAYILYLVEKNERLRQEIQNLRDNPGPISRIAREELGLVKPGEIIYRYYPKFSPEK